MSEVPKEVHGLLLAAELALKEVQKKLPSTFVGSPDYSARTELANALYAMEMVKYHVRVMESETKTSTKI